MSKVEKWDLKRNLTFTELQGLRWYESIRKKFIKFSNRLNLYLSKEVFSEEGERLWEIFVNKCDRDIDEFLKCLTWEQQNILYIYVIKNIQ